MVLTGNGHNWQGKKLVIMAITGKGKKKDLIQVSPIIFFSWSGWSLGQDFSRTGYQYWDSEVE